MSFGKKVVGNNKHHAIAEVCYPANYEALLLVRSFVPSPTDLNPYVATVNVILSVLHIYYNMHNDYNTSNALNC